MSFRLDKHGLKWHIIQAYFKCFLLPIILER